MVGKIGVWTQELYDSFFIDAETDAELKNLFDEIQFQTREKCGQAIGVPTDQDPGMLRQLAKWMASWIPALCALYVATGQPWPKDLSTMWNRFEKGGWPCEHVLNSPEQYKQHKQLYSNLGYNSYAAFFENTPNTFKIF